VLPSRVALALVFGLAAVAGLHPARAEVAADADGQRIYQRDCAFCHGASAEGTKQGQPLRGIGDAEVDYAVSTGRMPLADPGDERRRRPAKYSRAQIDALVAYLRPFTAGGPGIPDVRSNGRLDHGGELFRAQCASCHQWAAEGGGLLGLNAPSLHDSTPTQIGEAVRTGPVTMPAFSTGTLSDADVNDIAAYVRYLRHPRDRGGLGLWHLGPFAEGLIAWVVGIGVLLLGLNWIGTRE
jgi:ubiquinol-cytochrome c reductase cytochrome c subunit